MSAYSSPTCLDDALALLAIDPVPGVLAGGTDLYPATQNRALSGPVLDLCAIHGLRGITTDAGGLRIGACTTWSDLIAADLPPALCGLQQAATQVGGVQIQNAGTVGGNLCNASPAADGVPPLLVLEAEVTLASATGMRRLALSDFLLGPRRTALLQGEVLTEITIPKASLTGTSQFVKLGARAYLVISIAMVAVRVCVRDGRIAQAALAVGSCSAVAQRLPMVESRLVGLSPHQAAASLTTRDIAATLAPLDDLRATATYRVQAATELLRRALAEALA